MWMSGTVRAVALALAVGVLPVPAAATPGAGAAPDTAGTTAPSGGGAQDEVQPPPAGVAAPGWTAAIRSVRPFPHRRTELVLIGPDGSTRVVSAGVGWGRVVEAVSLDARWVLVSQELPDGRRRHTVWDTHTRRHSTFTVSGALGTARMTTSGQVVLADRITDVVTVHEATGRVLRTLPPTRDPSTVTLFVTPDGERIVQSGAEGFEVRPVRGGPVAPPVPLPPGRTSCGVASLWDEGTATVVCSAPDVEPDTDPRPHDVYAVPLDGRPARFVLRTPWSLRHTSPNPVVHGQDHGWIFVAEVVDGRPADLRLDGGGLPELVGAHGSDVWVRRRPAEAVAGEDPADDDLLRVDLATGREHLLSPRVTSAAVVDGQD